MRTLFISFSVVALAGLVGCGGEIDDNGPPSIESASTAVSCDGPFNCKLPAHGGPAHGSVDGNRAINKADRTYEFPLEANAHMRDGAGTVRGVVSSHSIKINYGQRKTLVGVKHVYAFGATLTDGTGASGWVREGALLDGELTNMPTVSGENPGQGDYQKVFVVTGGDLTKYAGLKVNPKFTGSHREANDYLVRPGNVVNLCYNLPGSGGVSTDTFFLGAEFHRSKGVKQVMIDLYHPGGSSVVGQMPFIYGHIGGRYGWIARDALE